MIPTYSFLSDEEPTDEQLHLLMQEVAIEAKKKAEKANKQFWAQLQQMVNAAKNQKPYVKPDKR